MLAVIDVRGVSGVGCWGERRDHPGIAARGACYRACEFGDMGQCSSFDRPRSRNQRAAGPAAELDGLRRCLARPPRLVRARSEDDARRGWRVEALRNDVARWSLPPFLHRDVRVLAISLKFGVPDASISQALPFRPFRRVGFGVGGLGCAANVPPTTMRGARARG